MKQHKWHKEIKAWADGAEIEMQEMDVKNPKWIPFEGEWYNSTHVKYRIKPQPKVKKWLWATADGKDSTFGFHASGEDADKYEGNSDGLLYIVKLTWSETEFEVDDD